MKRVFEATVGSDRAEVKISGYLTVAQIRRLPNSTDDEWTVFLDNRKTGKTATVGDPTDLPEAMSRATAALLRTFRDEEQESIEGLLEDIWVRSAGVTLQDLTHIPPVTQPVASTHSSSVFSQENLDA